MPTLMDRSGHGNNDAHNMLVTLRRASSLTSLLVWNSLPVSLCDSDIDTGSFKHLFKVLVMNSVHSTMICYIN